MEAQLQIVRSIALFCLIFQNPLFVFAFNYEEFRLQFNDERPLADLGLIRQLVIDGLLDIRWRCVRRISPCGTSLLWKGRGFLAEGKIYAVASLMMR